MGDDGSTYILGLSPLNIAIIGAVASVAVLIIYHFWVTRRSNRHVETFLHRRRSPATIENNAPPTTVVENNSTVAELLHSYEYSINVELISKTQDQTCAVCLSEFVNGELVRVLPGCMHPFHVPCIDMWLSSHSSCPLCRTALQVAVRSSEESPPSLSRLPAEN